MTVGEFPANYFPWQRLQMKGVQVTWLSIDDPLDHIDEACRGARLLAISFVQYISGYRAPLQAIGEICRRNRCLFLVDAIQGLGAFPLDVHSCRIHALAADGHKWMLGPEGCGILYLDQEIQELVEPVEFGWTNIARYASYESRDMTLRPDAGRYECGTLNTIGCYGLRAAIEFLLEVGIEQIGSSVQYLADRLDAGVRAKGYESMRHRTADTSAGIVSFRKTAQDPGVIVHNWKSKGISATSRGGWVRVSPHFYIHPSDIDIALAALPS
jgi:selenocysteine lyase/cysteine desulfurase